EDHRAPLLGDGALPDELPRRGDELDGGERDLRGHGGPRPRWPSRAGPGRHRACACRHRDRRDRLRRRGLRVAAGDARSRARGDRAGGGMSRPADRDEALATDALTRVPVAEEGRARWLSANPDKAWGERFFLLYSPIWMVAF